MQSLLRGPTTSRVTDQEAFILIETLVANVLVLISLAAFMYSIRSANLFLKHTSKEMSALRNLQQIHYLNKFSVANSVNTLSNFHSACESHKSTTLPISITQCSLIEAQSHQHPLINSSIQQLSERAFIQLK